MNKKRTLPSLLGVFLLLSGVAGGVLLVNRQQVFRLGASPDFTPRDVRLSNIKEDSFTVSWVTDKPSVGFINWGETSNLGSTQQSVAGGQTTTVHAANIQGLSKGRTYYFAINSNGTSYQNGATPWSQATSSIAQAGTTVRISGTVLEDSGSPAGGVLVFVTQNNFLYSTVASATGNWVISFNSSNKDGEIDVFVQGGERGIATAKSTASNSNPMGAITLGKTHDFRGMDSPDQDTSVTSASISGSNSAPTATPTARLNTSAQSGSAPETVTLESIENGETIFTNRPQVFGEAPPSTRVNITINSETQITGVTTANTNGEWSFTTPTELEDGDHTVTVRWIDAAGIARTITRNFTVNAQASEPAFESTPTGTLRPTPTATATARPTTTPTATPVATKSATPAATVSTLPAAGSTEVTIALAVFGLILTALGVFTVKKTA